jgi:hypothetical protein
LLSRRLFAVPFLFPFLSILSSNVHIDGFGDPFAG